MPKLHNWGIRLTVTKINGQDTYQFRLTGNVLNHPKQQDGAAIITSVIIERENETFYTADRTPYTLEGHMHPIRGLNEDKTRQMLLDLIPNRLDPDPNLEGPEYDTLA